METKYAAVRIENWGDDRHDYGLVVRNQLTPEEQVQYAKENESLREEVEFWRNECRATRVAVDEMRALLRSIRGSKRSTKKSSD